MSGPLHSFTSPTMRESRVGPAKAPIDGTAIEPANARVTATNPAPLIGGNIARILGLDIEAIGAGAETSAELGDPWTGGMAA